MKRVSGISGNRRRSAFVSSLGTKSAENRREVVVFSLGAELYAIDIGSIDEIRIPPLLTPVPLTKPFVMGIIAVRGSLFPVLDLGIFLGMSPRVQTLDSRVIVFRLREEMLAFYVDRVQGVLAFTIDEIKPLSEALLHDKHLYHGVFTLQGAFVSYLNFEQILASPALHTLSTRGNTGGIERRIDQADTAS